MSFSGCGRQAHTSYTCAERNTFAHKVKMSVFFKKGNMSGGQWNGLATLKNLASLKPMEEGESQFLNDLHTLAIAYPHSSTCVSTLKHTSYTRTTAIIIFFWKAVCLRFPSQDYYIDLRVSNLFLSTFMPVCFSCEKCENKYQDVSVRASEGSVVKTLLLGIASLSPVPGTHSWEERTDSPRVEASPPLALTIFLPLFLTHPWAQEF